MLLWRTVYLGRTTCTCFDESFCETRDVERLRNDISIHTANIVYKSYILPKLDYCDTVWNCYNVGDEEKFEKIQRRVARVVTKVGRSHGASNDLRWETLNNMREPHVFKLVKKFVNGTVLQFLKNYPRANGAKRRFDKILFDDLTENIFYLIRIFSSFCRYINFDLCI